MEESEQSNARPDRRPGGSTTEKPHQTLNPDTGPRCLAVMYHYVHDVEPVTSHGVGGLTTKAFHAQLDRLCRIMAPVDWPTLYAWKRGRGDVPDRCFLLTFDDGLADQVNVVRPILQERNLRGVFFVPGAVLSTERLLAAHAIHLLFANLGDHRLHEELLAYLADQGDDTDWISSLDTAAAERMYHYEPPRRAHLKYLLTMILPIELRGAAIRTLFEQHVGSLTRWARTWYLTWDQVVGLQSLGHTVGGHGYGHESYGRLSPEECRQDIHRAAAVLRSGLGADKRPFSYPYGSYNEDAVSACREAGFAHAFTTEQGWITQKSDPLALPRVDTMDVEAVLDEEVVCAQV